MKLFTKISLWIAAVAAGVGILAVVIGLLGAFDQPFIHAVSGEEVSIRMIPEVGAVYGQVQILFAPDEESGVSVAHGNTAMGAFEGEIIKLFHNAFPVSL